MSHTSAKSPGTSEVGGRSPDPDPVDMGGSPSAPSKNRLITALISVGPFAGALTVYGVLVDDLQDDWFAYVVLKYIFAGIGALCVDLALRLLAQHFTFAQVMVGDILPVATVSPSGVRHDARVKSPYQIFADTNAALLADLRVGSREGIPTYGWSQYAGDNVLPSAIGSSYGLRIALALDVRSPAVHYGRLTASLLALQRQGGGWAASTQRGIGRPEVTAIVLGAAYRAGLDEQTLTTLTRLLEQLADADDPVSLNHTSNVATIVTTLADVAPESATLLELAVKLARGASVIGSAEAPASWGEVLNGGPKDSVPHTARTVVALKKAVRVLPQRMDLESAANAGIAWLVAEDRALAPIDEQVRRPMSGGDVDALIIGHFSAAWTARAIMNAPDPSAHENQLRRAMQAVLAPQHAGLWSWHDGSKPLWMTYQGIYVIRDYVLRGFEWPP